MFNLETETSSYLDVPSDGETTAFCCRLMECDGLPHYIRIGIGSRLTVWKMSMMSNEWLILHNVDLNKAIKRDLYSFSLYGGDIRNLKPIAMSCQGDDKVLFAYYSCPFLSYGRIVSYDLRRDVFELVFPEDFLFAWMFFRYTPAKMSISKR
ncbi:hypothetical protein MRB53_027583 [Persea americana]|uniref:Uncharacterized protein n=1 Tax=Persea americana TaxID=3435 RepID=A0ACC2LMD1_PERAE|nr:hypothetical protein MRB53_027583 [Persea americana]